MKKAITINTVRRFGRRLVDVKRVVHVEQYAAGNTFMNKVFEDLPLSRRALLWHKEHDSANLAALETGGNKPYSIGARVRISR